VKILLLLLTVQPIHLLSIGKAHTTSNGLKAVIAVIVLATDFIAPWAIKRLCAANYQEGSFVVKD